MRYLFLVQGEGRGHMTQAIVLSKILNTQGHEVVHTFIGKSDRRVIPNYFYEQLESEISTLNSPNFILDKENKALKLSKSIIHNARFLGKYKKSLDQIHKKVKATKPNIIVNFNDFLGGFYFRFYNPYHVKHVCIGRQFLTLHPDYPFVPNREVEKNLYLTNIRLTSQKCDKYLALSFRPYDPIKIDKLVVVPPLIKKEIKQINSMKDDYFLGYMVNDGYAEEVIKWQAENSETSIHCFWDRKNMPSEFSPQPNLYFHQINNSKFNDMMKRCKGYISTAGFESICEAFYLQKPIMMIPVKSQYEQACNALDAEITGVGISATSFDVSQLQNFLPQYHPNQDFRNWVDQTESIFLQELTNF